MMRSGLRSLRGSSAWVNRSFGCAAVLFLGLNVVRLSKRRLE
ncbi:MAG: hypothetical protein AVDCRST_MAG15-1377 [uncultured Rubellimicrobium sp.]|uniref:Uncharacterized protein n=1 Tax=uncultured Rubellimicrobium sp. TaxID=543078 RepID=A0A6J4P6B3_9RHOB|nr:MAG: hypothetical protein AVDCRST_MAG15-1377 [uncultured Rubellimicrobium sp.]